MEYRLDLPPTLAHMHDVFHISLLKKYVMCTIHVIDWHMIQAKLEGDFQVQLMQIGQEGQSALESSNWYGKDAMDHAQS